MSVDFEKASREIVAALLKRVPNNGDESEVVKYVYNEAIDDAANFARDLAVKNPQHRLALEDLERQLRHWLTLR